MHLFTPYDIIEHFHALIAKHIFFFPLKMCILILGIFKKLMTYTLNFTDASKYEVFWIPH